MNIRDISESDNAAIALIIRNTLKEFQLDIPGTAYYDPELDSLSDYYARDGRRYLICEDENGTVIGGCGYAEFGSNQTAEMQKLYLIPACRGKGISTILIKEIEASAKADGYHTLYLETHHNLMKAVQIYEKFGYKRLEKPLGNSPHTTMDYFFCKKLT